jgi:hypothetical protein
MNQPDVTKFLNESLRPFAEKLRAMNFELSALRYAYATGVGPIIDAAVAVDPDEMIDDGRAAEGVNQLSVGQVAALMGMITELKALVDADASLAGMAAGNRACVRPLRITSVGSAG